MQDAVHGAARALQRSFERVHRPGDVLLEGIRHEDVVLSPVAVVRAGAREVIDSVMYVVRSAGAVSGGIGCWCPTGLRRLLRENNARASSGGDERGEFVEVPASRAWLHDTPPF